MYRTRNNSNLYLNPRTENINPESSLSSKPETPFTSSQYSNKTNIDKYFQTKENMNPYVIPQYKRMQLLQQRIRALEDQNNEQNKKILEMMEREYENRMRYPKYTIIQNTPLTSREEIINKILEKKFGPNYVHSTNFPIVTYKNDIEINELIASTGAELLRMKDEKEKDEIKRKKLYEDSKSIYDNNNNNNNNINNRALLNMQKENFELRNNLQNTIESMKKIKNDLENQMESVLNKQKLTIESLRNIIEKGGSKKLKASMYNILENKDIDLSVISDEEKEFKEVELPKIIQEKIEENEKKKYYDNLKYLEKEQLSNRKDELPPIYPFNRTKSSKISSKKKTESKKESKSKISENEENEENESSDDVKKKDKNKSSDNEESESDDNKKKKKKKSKKKKDKKGKKGKKEKKDKKKDKKKKGSDEEEYEFSDKSVELKTDNEQKNEESDSQKGVVPLIDLLEDWD